MLHSLALFFSLNFVTGSAELMRKGFWLLTKTSDFHCSAAFGVGPGVKILRHVLAWLIDSEYSKLYSLGAIFLKGLGHSWKYRNTVAYAEWLSVYQPLSLQCSKLLNFRVHFLNQGQASCSIPSAHCIGYRHVCAEPCPRNVQWMQQGWLVPTSMGISKFRPCGLTHSDCLYQAIMCLLVSAGYLANGETQNQCSSSKGLRQRFQFIMCTKFCIHWVCSSWTLFPSGFGSQQQWFFIIVALGASRQVSTTDWDAIYCP